MIVNYETDVNARYLAMRVLQNETNPNTGVEYNKAITSTKITKEAIDYWITKLRV